MILQVHTEKELIALVESLKEEVKKLRIKSELSTEALKVMQSEIDKKPNIEIRETVTRELEKQTIIENVIVKTDSSLAPALKELGKRLHDLEINRQPAIKTDSTVMPAIKKLSDRLAELESAEPKIKIKETVIKEIEKPTIIQKTLIQTDPAVMPTLKKLSGRLKHLESKKPELQIIKELTTHEIKTVGAASKKEIEDIKKSILEIKPVINNLTTGVTSDDVLKLINKHVILSYINKLYGR